MPPQCGIESIGSAVTIRRGDEVHNERCGRARPSSSGSRHPYERRRRPATPSGGAHDRSRPPCMVSHMSRQALGNAAAGILFLIVAIVDFTRDSSGIGVVFVVFAAVFLGLAASARKSASAR